MAEPPLIRIKTSPRWARWLIAAGARDGRDRQPREWKPSRRERRVLLALLSGASNLSGYPIGQAAQVSSGRVYITLDRLEDMGWVTGEWGPETNHGKRRFYRLTDMGRRLALEALGLEEDRG